MKYKILLVLFGLVTIVFGSGITYSIFHSESTLTSSDQKIAQFIFDTEETNSLHLSLTGINPGDTKEYSFKVSNTKELLTSNVTINYQMIIRTFHLIPLHIELLKLNNELWESLMICNESYTRNANNELVCNSAINEMSYRINSNDQYKLVVTFPPEYNDESYVGLVDYIDMEIKSWQKTGD